MEQNNIAALYNKQEMYIRFTREQGMSLFKILKLVNSHVQVMHPDGSHFLVIGEESRRRKEYLRDVEAVFIEKMLDKLSDLLEVKL
jgi:hypothetical protein